MVGTQSVSFSAAVRPAAIEILPPSRHDSGRQKTVRPVFAVERPRSAVDAAEQFTPQRLKQGSAEARHEQPREEPDTQAAERRAEQSRAASAEILRFPVRGAGMAATGFVAQLLAQGLGNGVGPALSLDPPGGAGGNAALGNEAYRRAGGEPAIYGEEPAYFRVAI